MLIDDLKEQLKATDPDIQIIQEYWQHSGIDQKILALQAQT